MLTMAKPIWNKILQVAIAVLSAILGAIGGANL